MVKEKVRKVVLTKEQIDEIFEKASHQAEYVLGLYELVIGPDFSDCKKIKDWPKAGPKVYEYVMLRAIEFDRKHHPDVLPGGLWVNYGFSLDKNLGDWEVDISEVEIER